MKLHLPLLVFLTAFFSSCYVTKTTNLYHHFTNEFDVVGEVQTEKIQVYHQIIGNDLSIKMVNISDSNYLFNWSKSTISINDRILPTVSRTGTSLIPSNNVFEISVPLVQELSNQGISLKDTSQAIVVKTYFTYSDVSEQTHYTNTYTFERISTSSTIMQKEGVNALKTTEQEEELQGGTTVMGLLLSTFVVIVAATSDEPEEFE
ncbi:MAG: hypothetical protein ACPGYY_04770 [Bacteroidia bacterium]